MRRIIVSVAVLLFAVWTWGNIGRISSDPDWVIRFVLSGLFAFLIMIRSAHSYKVSNAAPVAGRIIFVGLAGVACAVCGIVFHVHQLEWLGLIVLLYVSLRWALPHRRRSDLLMALFIVYWIHPLPGQVFGKLQLYMQYLSVNGSEWLLQCFNRRVWADGMILRTGLASYGVPESCSGMRTVVTVMLCTLGVGALMRLKWLETAVFLVLGLVQVLLLNILRITFMLLWVDRMPAGWGETFLHDSLGVFLLISILLVQAEASWWRIFSNRKKLAEIAIESGDVEPPDLATILPRFWQHFTHRGVHFGLILFIVLAVAFAFYKRRPYHRVMMLNDVVEDLMETNLEAAEKGINHILQIYPGDARFVEKKAHILVMRNKSSEALAVLDDQKEPLSGFEKIMRSWALMSLGRDAEAVAEVADLPDDLQMAPQVAMMRAEYAVRQNKPNDLRKYIVMAATHHSTINRVRNLFLYMAMHGMWDVIVAADAPDVPYRDFEHALVAIEANLNMNHINGAAVAMRLALSRWPNEMRLLHSLFLLAQKQPSGEWEALFADNLKANISVLDVDRLAAYIDYCFQLNRPDLAWLAYARLRSVDKSDPSVFLMPAQHGHDWFTFRSQMLGLKATNPRATVDLKPFCRMTRNMEPFSYLWDQVPLVDDLLGDNANILREKYMSMCLAELRKRSEDGLLTWRTRMMFPMVLAMEGDFDEAHVMQDAVVRDFPELREQALLKHAKFYTWQSKWEQAYETLRSYRELYKGPELEAQIMYVNALMNMNMGICSMDVVRMIKKEFPASREAFQMEGLIWNAYGFKEEALFVLGQYRAEIDDRVLVQLLYDTGRYIAAEKMGRIRQVVISKTGNSARQETIVPAESAVLGRWPDPLSDGEMDKEAARLEEESKTSQSPFVKAYKKMTAEWYRVRGQGEVSGVDKWSGIGRDNAEKAEALNQLAILLARHKQIEQAIGAADLALKMMPTSPILWRTYISLSKGDAGVVDSARRMCPDDSEIWIASLIARCRSQDKAGLDALGEKLSNEMEAVVEKKQFPVGSAVRAGDFLFRMNMVKPASILARYAIENGDGYLAAYVLGLRCALISGDRRWALKCALGGVENAMDPVPFYKTIVTIKSSAGDVDTDLVGALEYLRERFPQVLEWTEGLGYAYYKKGDLSRSTSVLSSLVNSDSIRNAKPGSLMLAAEVARQMGEDGDAIRVLRMAHNMHPDDFKVLNNLVYNLAQHPETVAQAMVLLEDLLKVAGDDFIVYDTAAMVYMRSGQVEKADFFMTKALELIDDSSAALEVKLNSAELMYRKGEYRKAKTVLEKVRGESSQSRMIDRRAADLLGNVEKMLLRDKNNL